MYFKQKLAYMALGCLFTIIGYILASLSGNPVDAQPQADKSEPTIIDVDRVVCRELRVVNDDDKPAVSIGAGSDGGYIIVDRASGENAVAISADSKGGFMSVRHANSKPAVNIGTTFFDGGYISVYHANSKPTVNIGTTSDGGYMAVHHASGEKAAEMAIGIESKEGFIAVKRKDQKGSIQLSASEYGGFMAIFNKGEQNVLQAGVGDTGSGIITTRDKHGYRTGRLP